MGMINTIIITGTTTITVTTIAITPIGHDAGGHWAAPARDTRYARVSETG
jgi:hypothetical protein